MSLIVPFDLEIQNLKMFDNIKQLEILIREVSYITKNGIKPLNEWYDDRFEFIVTYSKLDWNGMVERFNGKDKYIYDTVLLIMQLITRLLEERATKRFFYIPTYHTMLYNISAVWEYYNTKYVCGETDINVVDIVEGLMYM
jgi:hypothetical protein